MEEKKSQRNVWLKRFGIGGFLFFLIKGLIWLFIFFGLGAYLGC